jgi:transcriptional regulator GlxA family with amidase domain
MAGLLDGYTCTIHWENQPGFIEEFPEINVTSSLFEIDRDRFTGAGGTSALDMILALISSQHGVTLATQVAENILHSPIRQPGEHQRMSLPARIGARHPKMVEIIEQMEQNLEEPLSPSVLAKQAGLSTRQLERLFRRYLDRSPKRYYLELRLEEGALFAVADQHVGDQRGAGLRVFFTVAFFEMLPGVLCQNALP